MDGVDGAADDVEVVPPEMAVAIVLNLVFSALRRRRMERNPEMPDRRRPAKQSWKQIGNRSVIVFLTVCTKAREPILGDAETHDLLVKAWEKADSWVVGRYVILPDHVHLFASPHDSDSPDVAQWVSYWKSLVTRQWAGRRVRSIWQRDFWDRQLRSGESYAQKWEYVRSNPVRHGLVQAADDWPFQGKLNDLAWHD